MGGNNVYSPERQSPLYTAKGSWFWCMDCQRVVSCRITQISQSDSRVTAIAGHKSRRPSIDASHPSILGSETRIRGDTEHLEPIRAIARLLDTKLRTQTGECPVNGDITTNLEQLLGQPSQNYNNLDFPIVEDVGATAHSQGFWLYGQLSGGAGKSYMYLP
jgi:hypothetical protein